MVSPSPQHKHKLPQDLKGEQLREERYKQLCGLHEYIKREPKKYASIITKLSEQNLDNFVIVQAQGEGHDFDQDWLKLGKDSGRLGATLSHVLRWKKEKEADDEGDEKAGDDNTQTYDNLNSITSRAGQSVCGKGVSDASPSATTSARPNKTPKTRRAASCTPTSAPKQVIRDETIPASGISRALEQMSIQEDKQGEKHYHHHHHHVHHVILQHPASENGGVKGADMVRTNGSSGWVDWLMQEREKKGE